MFTRILFGLLGLLTAGTALAGQKDRTLDIYWIDSEGGGSTLIVTPDDESVLIDTGNPGGRDANRIVTAVKAAGLSRIDHVLITHWHTDHFGGAAEVAEQVPIGALYHREIPAGDPDGRPQSTFPMQIKPFRAIEVRREPLAPGVIIPLRPTPGGPRLELRCIAADKKTVAPTAAQRATDGASSSAGVTREVPPSDNDNSAVFVLKFGDFEFFDGGDLTLPYEEKLVAPHNLVGTVDVYQTNHHGLDTSNNPKLVQGLQPTVVVMNNGPRKGGQPGSFAAIKTAPSVQARYQVHKSFNVPAAENAPADCVANHDDLRGAEAGKCPANVIKLSVAPDAQTYTVTIPATGHAREFRTKR